MECCGDAYLFGMSLTVCAEFTWEDARSGFAGTQLFRNDDLALWNFSSRIIMTRKKATHPINLYQRTEFAGRDFLRRMATERLLAVR